MIARRALIAPVGEQSVGVTKRGLIEASRTRLIGHRQRKSRMVNSCRDQRAACFASRAAGRPFPPLDHARSASQTARSSRATLFLRDT